MRSAQGSSRPCGRSRLALRRPVGPSHVLGEDSPRLDAAHDVDAHVAVERRADVVGAHRGRDADGARLVSPSRVERAGDLALAVEDAAALLDPAGHQHVRVDAEEILAVESCLSNLFQRADRLGFPGDGHSGGTLDDCTRISCMDQRLITVASSSSEGARWKSVRLAARRAPQGARRLGGLLSRLRRGSSLVRRLRGRRSGAMPAVRRRDAAPRPSCTGAVQLDLRGRLRVLRDPAPGSRAVRNEDPPPLADLAEANHGHRVPSGVTSRL